MQRTRNEESLAKARMLVGVAAVPAVPLLILVLQTAMDVSIAGVLAAGVPSAALGVIEWRSHQERAPDERVRSAVEGRDYRRPAVVVAYAVLAVQLQGFVVGLVVGVGVGAGLSPYSAPPDVAESIAVTTAVIVSLPLTWVTFLVVSVAAARRLADRRLGWLAVAVAVNAAVNLVTGVLLVGADAIEIRSSDALLLVVVNAAYVGACAIGVAIANRREDVHRLAKAYRALPEADRKALIELALVNAVSGSHPIPSPDGSSAPVAPDRAAAPAVPVMPPPALPPPAPRT